MFQDIVKCINKHDCFLIFPHISPDGDCIGSAYGLKLMLERLGKQACVVLEEGEPESYTMKIVKGLSPAVNYKSYAAIAVDCADEGRLGKRLELFKNGQATVNIDHHPTNTLFADYNCVDAEASAAGEIVYGLGSALGGTIDEGAAHNLYMAIASDSGCFAYANTTAKTHEIAAELLKFNIDATKINEALFSNQSMAEIKLMGLAADSLETYYDGTVSAVSLTWAQIAGAGGTDDSTGGIISVPRSLEGSRVALFFKEKSNGEIKVSMRSKGEDVSKVAVAFGGGGHVRASGCSFNKPMEEVKQIIIKEIGKIL